MSLQNQADFKVSRPGGIFSNMATAAELDFTAGLGSERHQWWKFSLNLD